jgi:hypothetical protein
MKQEEDFCSGAWNIVGEAPEVGSRPDLLRRNSYGNLMAIKYALKFL